MPVTIWMFSKETFLRLQALARTKYTTLVDVYDYVDVEEMRRYVERNGDQRTKTAAEQE